MFPSRASEKWMEKKELAEQEAVKSLKAFRWRDYWQCSSACVVSLGDSSFGEEEVGEKEDMGNDKENNMLYGILLQVLSLAKFIIKSGSRPLEGSFRHRSMVSHDPSLKVTRSLSFPLSKYFYSKVWQKI
ncbi:hypothetical protein HID58_088172 [Brassica napus]|uniref:BnaCnng65970D protein n=2 Tax=Brassica napus TaxID=3708 RepID=A0A078JQR5_BRANA|nr:hypothetical protein HID58_088172 [Brassica napus]CAF1767410.1 unnamed protein product [Brassica napus]CDY69928.1 BnaCnng65970D [Brassica napus]